jgi:nucleoid-associated protein YgaU
VSTFSSSDIQALIDSGHITEAGTLLTMHGDELPPKTREDLETRRQQLWNKAETLIAQGESHELQGNNREAQECYQQAAKVAVDFPGLQERRKRITETLALTDAVRLRSKRIRTQGKQAKGSKRSGSSGAPLLTGALLLALAVGGWWYLSQQKSQPNVPTQNEQPAVISQNDQVVPLAPSTTPPPQLQEQRSAPQASAEAPVAELGAQIRAATTDTVEQAEADAQELVQSLTETQVVEQVQLNDQLSEPEPLAMEATQTQEPQAERQPLPQGPLPANEPNIHEDAQPAAPAQSIQNPPVLAPAPTPPAELEPSLPLQTETQYYTVKPGDALSKITKRVLCNQDAWTKLYARNKELIDNPDLLLPGTKLNLQGVENLCSGKQTP